VNGGEALSQLFLYRTTQPPTTMRRPSSDVVEFTSGLSLFPPCDLMARLEDIHFVQIMSQSH